LLTVGLSVSVTLLPGSIPGIGETPKGLPGSVRAGPNSEAVGLVQSSTADRPGSGLNSSSSTPTWVEEVSSRYHPSNRFTPGLVYDATDGYVVLYGGWINSSNEIFAKIPAHCMNDTWTYQGGQWTNLSIRGMPPSCDPAMAYDPVLREVVAYFTFVNETWTFSHGRWAELQNLSNPYVCTYAWGICNNQGGSSVTDRGYFLAKASMTYDPAVKSVILTTFTWVKQCGVLECYDLDTWELESIGWVLLSGIPETLVQSFPSRLASPLTYDWTGGVATLVNVTYSPPDGLSNMKLWVATFNGTEWNRTARYIMSADQNESLLISQSVFDPTTGATLFLIGKQLNWLTPPMVLPDQMWEYRNGLLQNVTRESPPPSSTYLSSLTFDGKDGYVLMFGGLGESAQGGYTISNETWILGRPMSLEVKDSVQPGMVCPVTEGGCEAGTDTARVNVSISAVPFENGTASESQIGQLIRGPVGWAPELSMTFVGWGSIVPAPNLDPQVRCFNEVGGQMACPTDPAQSPGPGPPVLRWNWSEDPSMLEAGFAIGDRWIIQFNVVALGPPFGVVPVDSCITTSCLAEGSGSLGRLYSNYGYGQWENGTRVRQSLPLMEVGVLSPDVGSAPAPNPPPPPPVPIGVPVHVPTPSPTPVAPLQSLLIPTVAATGTPVTPILAGILAAGGMRAAIETRSRSLQVAVKVRRGIIPVDKQIPSRGPR